MKSPIISWQTTAPQALHSRYLFIPAMDYSSSLPPRYLELHWSSRGSGRQLRASAQYKNSQSVSVPRLILSRRYGFTLSAVYRHVLTELFNLAFRQTGNLHNDCFFHIPMDHAHSCLTICFLSRFLFCL